MFHTRGPAAAKHRSPKLLFDRRTIDGYSVCHLFLVLTFAVAATTIMAPT